MTSTGIILFCVFLCILAFLLTFRFGATQNQTHNEQYTQNRKKTFLVLAVIYLLATIIGVIFVFLF
jgi:heme/copper-type cytochrome/quinol oxidase subunit 2